MAVVRRWTHEGRISATTAVGALEGLGYWPVRRVAHVPLLQDAFALRANYSAYDALYLVVAQVFGATIVTCDGRLARSPRVPGVEVRNIV